MLAVAHARTAEAMDVDRSASLPVLLFPFSLLFFVSFHFAAPGAQRSASSLLHATSHPAIQLAGVVAHE